MSFLFQLKDIPTAYSPPKSKQKAELIYQNKSLLPTNFDFKIGKEKPRIRSIAAKIESTVLLNGNSVIPFAVKYAYVEHSKSIKPTAIVIKCGYNFPLSTISTMLLPAPKKR